MRKSAFRNLRLCTKDCLCLYVCPTGATDTENSVIDVDKCIGCGACAEACPSSAISMLSQPLPPQQPKAGEVISVLNGLTARKAIQENMARQLAAGTDRDGFFRLMSAAARSERLVAEDILREAGYMLPQSNRTHALLQELIANPPAPDFPAETARKLLSLILNNERSFP